MDPLSALSVASSVVQFVDFASKLVSGSYEIYQSAAGEAERSYELRTITNRLVRLNKTLEKSLSDPPGQQLSPSEKDLLPLCRKCTEVTKKLLDALNKLTVQSRVRVWSSFCQALRMVWSQGDIDELQKRLDAFKQQVSMHLLVSLREQIIILSERHSQSLHDTQLISERFLDHIDSSREIQGDIIRAIYRSHRKDRSYLNLREPPENMTQYIKPDDVRWFSRWLIHRIKYQEMENREEGIVEAYKKTFEWIFHASEDKRWSDFPKWLQGDDSIYWITGKAGAGKSTLVKFIWKNPQTQNALQVWAAGKQLISSAFFFWNSGTPMQMSQEGLLRTLLHGILSKCPDMVPIVFPERFEECILFGDASDDSEPWTWPELQKAFKVLVEECNNKMKLILFIDGLDEFHGEHTILIDLIQSLLVPNVKICTSSRPWIVFEDAFARRPSLMLEDLTYPDIKHYVVSKLSGNLGFCTFQRMDPDSANQLMENVTLKASGVFLWVVLVVRSLLDGLTGGERLSDLQIRLDSLPADLETLFWKILNHLDPTQFVRASQMFQILHGAIAPISLLQFWFADEDVPDYIFELPIKPLSKVEEDSRAEIMRRRLNTYCKGLIEAKTSALTVGYLHRTVKDFLKREDVWGKLLVATSHSFNFNLCLCRSQIAMLKIHGLGPLTGTAFWKMIILCNEYAFRAFGPNPGIASLQVRLLHEMDHAASEFGPAQAESGRSLIERYSRVRSHWVTIPDRRFVIFGPKDTYLHLAVQFQFISYVQASLEEAERSVQKPNVSSLLTRAVCFFQYLGQDSLACACAEPNFEIVKLLLSHGADPNKDFQGKTLWEHVLTRLRYIPRIKNEPLWYSIGKLFLEYGADPWAKDIAAVRDRDAEFNKLVNKRRRSTRLRYSWKRLLGG